MRCTVQSAVCRRSCEPILGADTAHGATRPDRTGAAHDRAVTWEGCAVTWEGCAITCACTGGKGGAGHAALPPKPPGAPAEQRREQRREQDLLAPAGDCAPGSVGASGGRRCRHTAPPRCADVVCAAARRRKSLVGEEPRWFPPRTRVCASIAVPAAAVHCPVLAYGGRCSALHGLCNVCGAIKHHLD
eukprot:408804-Rhodomonas_salina.3